MASVSDRKATSRALRSSRRDHRRIFQKSYTKQIIKAVQYVVKPNVFSILLGCIEKTGNFLLRNSSAKLNRMATGICNILSVGSWGDSVMTQALTF